jgi:hypothetical protein
MRRNLINKTLHNPYLDEYLEVKNNSIKALMLRNALVIKYSWAIPDDGAIKILTQYPITEIGAGKGYWAKLISDAGGNINAYDISYPNGKKNRYIDDSDYWYPVNLLEKDTIVDVTKKAAKEKRTLFICWPSYSQPWAYEYLKTYIQNSGPRLIYIGEGFGGCTADDDFHSLISEKGNIVQEYSIPHWEGVNDFLQVVEFNLNKVF